MDLALKQETEIPNIKLEALSVENNSKDSRRRILAPITELTNLCKKGMSSKAVYLKGKVKIYLTLDKPCRDMLAERIKNSGPTAVDSLKLGIKLPKNGKLKFLTVAPATTSTSMSKGQLHKFLLSAAKKDPQPKKKSSIISQLTDIKKLASFKAKDLGEKAKAADEAATITTYLAYLGVGIGGFSLMQVAIMVSFLFRIIKKLIFLNTSYGSNMLYMLGLMNGSKFDKQPWMFKSTWYNYQNIQTHPLISPGAFHMFSIWSLKGLYIKILLIIIFRKIRRSMIKHFDKWRDRYGEKFFQIQVQKEKKEKTEQILMKAFGAGKGLKRQGTSIETKEQKNIVKKMGWKKKILLKIFHASYVVEIGAFGSCLMDIILSSGYDIINYSTKINKLTVMGVTNLILCYAAIIFISYELSR